MAGARLIYDHQGHEEAAAIIRELKTRLVDMTPLMAAIGEDILAGIEDAFEAERSPEGEAWEPSQRAILEGGKTLQDSRRLYSSLHVSAGPDKVEVGTNVIYAAVQQFGADQGDFGIFLVTVPFHARLTKHGVVPVREHQRRQPLPWGDIPARPFLGMSDDTRGGVVETLREYLVAGSE